jgi:hypothetical protein
MMNLTRLLGAIAAAGLLLATTGCFRVSSDTQALRDVALDLRTGDAEEKIEIGVGFFTVGLAKLGARFVELPPEVRSVLGSVDGVECSVYELRGGESNFAEVLSQADEVMDQRGSDRVVGVLDRDQLIAVYVPRSMNSHRDMAISVMVLTKRELICASARGDLDSVMQLAVTKAQEQFPKAEKVAGNF